MSAASTETQYRDDPEAAEPTSPVVEYAAPGGEEHQPVAPAVASQDATDADQPRRKFNFIRFHRITLTLAVIGVVGIFVFVILHLDLGPWFGWEPAYYFEDAAFKIGFWCLLIIAWAAIVLSAHRRRQPPPPMSVATVVHGIASLCLASTALSLLDKLMFSRGFQCWSPEPDAPEKCNLFVKITWPFALVYVVMLLVLSLLECILCIASLTTAYRSILFSRGSEHGVLLPGGREISFEFTVRFRRQDVPAPAPTRAVTSPPQRPPSPPPLISTE